MTRIVFEGEELAGLPTPGPAASIRLLLPEGGRLIIPKWNGNEFLLPDGSRPAIRTFTPRRYLEEHQELHVDIVRHEGGAASAWASAVRPGELAAISGPGRGYTIDPSAGSFLLAGDETAIPAICQLLEDIPHGPTIEVHVEIRDPEARVDLHRDVDEHWHVGDSDAAPGSALVESIRTIDIPHGARVWAAGEAAAMQSIRRHLTERGIDRTRANVRGYWKVKRR